MTSSLITAAHLAREAISCFLTHCAIEEDESTHHAFYKARIADAALKAAFDELAQDHSWVLRELKHLIDKKRMRTSVAKLENEIEGLRIQVQAKDDELELAKSIALECQREVDSLKDHVERLSLDLSLENSGNLSPTEELS